MGGLNQKRRGGGAHATQEGLGGAGLLGPLCFSFLEGYRFFQIHNIPEIELSHKKKGLLLQLLFEG